MRFLERQEPCNLSSFSDRGVGWCGYRAAPRAAIRHRRFPLITPKNVRDKDNVTLTPADQARGSQTDVEVTRRIREALTADTALSKRSKH